MTLEERIEALENKVAELNARTVSLIRLGPQPSGFFGNESVNRAVDDVLNEVSPVDRNARVLVSGLPETPDHLDINPATGQQKDYIVLSADERAKGFVRPVRSTYRHIKCGVITRMGNAIAETYARDPGFYSGTFCVQCKAHFPVGANGEFKWDDGSMVGT